MKIGVIPGDGLGKEITKQAIIVLETIAQKLNIECQIEDLPYSAELFVETGRAIPRNFIEEWKSKYNAILMGIIGNSKIRSETDMVDILFKLRSDLDLNLCVVPIQVLSLSHCPIKQIQDKNINLLIVRENLVDCYPGDGGHINIDTEEEIAYEHSIYTKKKVTSIIRQVFQYAHSKGIRKITLSDQANYLKYIGRLWRQAYEEVSQSYPEINSNYMILDTLHQEILRDLKQFELIITPYIFGTGVISTCTEIQGGKGIGTCAYVNIGQNRLKGIYQPMIKNDEKLEGKNQVNPIGSILSVAFMLEDQGYKEAAYIIREIIQDMLDREYVTKDLGGNYTTDQIGNYVCEKIKDWNECLGGEKNE